MLKINWKKFLTFNLSFVVSDRQEYNDTVVPYAKVMERIEKIKLGLEIYKNDLIIALAMGTIFISTGYLISALTLSASQLQDAVIEGRWLVFLFYTPLFAWKVLKGVRYGLEWRFLNVYKDFSYIGDKDSASVGENDCAG